ncbi:MAG: hypothetical protein RIS94_2322, partial [Pseudomonadota bacterium]
LMARVAPVATDCVYGPHARNRLDIYAPAGAQGLPVLLFVHGGGFRMGDKGGATNWQNAAVGRMAAEAGFVGAVMNYRLVPDAAWPDGATDVAAAVAWLRANVTAHGGDPERIVAMGTSAGAVHVAGAIHADAALPVRGAVLLSGLYGYTELDARDTAYYGEQATYAGRMPREAVAASALPLLVACSQYDPPRFQAEFVGLMQDRLARHGTMPRAVIVPGHNHYSLAMHLGTGDRRLADEIVAFVQDCC